MTPCSRRGWRLWGASLLLTLLLSSTSWAYVRSMTRAGDWALWWQEDALRWHLDLAGSDDLPDPSQPEAATLIEAVRRSWESWGTVDCSYGPFRMRLEEGEGLENTQQEYLKEALNHNILKWVENDDEWPHSRDVIGVTSVAYDARSGRILDADIEFNGIDYTYTTSNSPLRVRTDVQNSVTHEIGHLLGLDHSRVVGATMQASSPQGETSKRSLAEDDVEGVCSVLPLETLDPVEEDPPGLVCGARIAPGTGSGGATGWLLFALLLLSGRWRRNSRRRSCRHR